MVVVVVVVVVVVIVFAVCTGLRLAEAILSFTTPKLRYVCIYIYIFTYTCMYKVLLGQEISWITYQYMVAEAGGPRTRGLAPMPDI